MSSNGLNSGWGARSPIPQDVRAAPQATGGNFEAIIEAYLADRLVGCQFKPMPGLEMLSRADFEEMSVAGTPLEVAWGVLMEKGTRVDATMGGFCAATCLSKPTIAGMLISGSTPGEISPAEMAQRFRQLLKPN